MESFPGLRENRARFAGSLCGTALAVAGVFGLLGCRSRAAAVMAVRVAALAAWRLFPLAPALHCWSHDTVRPGRRRLVPPP